MGKNDHLSTGKTIREPHRERKPVEQKDYQPQLEAALRHALRSPLKKYKRGHFAAFAV